MAEPSGDSYPVPEYVDLSDCGIPLFFCEGPFKGKRVRTTATEIQKAIAGRKFARKDKRSLDPPPIVEVRFFEVHDNVATGTQTETEITDNSDLITYGLCCHVDLFSIPFDIAHDDIGSKSGGRAMTDVLHPHTLSSLTLTPDKMAGSSGGGGLPPYLPPLNAMNLPLPTLGPNIVPYHTSMQPPAFGGPPRSDVIAHYHNCPITEVSNASEILAGLRVTTPVPNEVNRSKEEIAFLFSDLAVQQEGSYAPRYRIFHLYAKVSDDGGLTRRTPVLASCWGGVFKVWSTKSFPGLAPSTELTKRMSLLGATVNVRSADRKGKGRKKRKTAPEDADDRGGARTRTRSAESPQPESRVAELRPASVPGSEAGSSGYVASSPDAAWGAGYGWGASPMAGPSAPSSESGGL